jgi:hypothetical protein
MFSNEQWLANSGADFYNGVATQSLRFDDGSSAYLTRTPDSAGNRKTWTWSGWVKRGALGSSYYMPFGADSGGGTGGALYFYNDFLHFGQGATTYRITNAVFRDVSSWYHVLLTLDTTDATAVDRVKIYINGNQVTSFSTTNNPSVNADLAFNNNVAHAVGADIPNTGARNYFDGYLSDVNFIDGLALTPSSFGEFKNGVWIPIDTSGLTFGTNGFRLQFEDNAVGTPENEGVVEDDNIGRDSSGKHNHWTSSGIVASDCAMPDSPENNFCTLNPIRGAYGNTNPNGTLAEGNLKFSAPNQTYFYNTAGTIFPTSGKWYWEVFIVSNSNDAGILGIVTSSVNTAEFPGWDTNGNGYGWSSTNGNKAHNNTSSSYVSETARANDIAGIALDLDNGTLTFYHNNASQGQAFSSIDSSKGWSFGFGTGYLSTWVVNFGQDSSFAGNKTAQGNTDGNGIGDFYYEPPSGYLALCTSNLPEPTIGANSLTQSTNHFGVLTYTGNDGANRDIVSGGSGVGGEIDFTPDLVWQKSRNATNWQLWFDSVRGATKLLGSNTTYQEQTQADSLSDFVLNGFTVSHNASTSDMNASAHTYVAWNWKANAGVTTTNDASVTGIGSRDSVYQSNTTAGFSIVTYTGGGNALETYAHGLQVNGVAIAPKVLIIKNRDVADAWLFGSDAIPNFNWANDYMHLQDTIAHQTNANGTAFQVAPTSTVFSVGGFLTKTNNYVAYCFAEVEGYSKFGSFSGNNSTDGSFVFLNFSPAFVMIKSTVQTESWDMHDNARNTFNVNDKSLLANVVNTENAVGVARQQLDFLSNGFKLRNQGDANPSINNEATTYIYMAFAESPHLNTLMQDRRI